MGNRYPRRVGETGSRTFVIIGNGVAGTSAAEVLRKGDPDARIVLIGECGGLPRFRRNRITRQHHGPHHPTQGRAARLSWAVEDPVVGVDDPRSHQPPDDGGFTGDGNAGYLRGA